MRDVINAHTTSKIEWCQILYTVLPKVFTRGVPYCVLLAVKVSVLRYLVKCAASRNGEGRKNVGVFRCFVEPLLQYRLQPFLIGTLKNKNTTQTVSVGALACPGEEI